MSTDEKGIIWYERNMCRHYLISDILKENGKPELTTVWRKYASVFTYQEKINLSVKLRSIGSNISLKFEVIKD